MKKGLVAGSSIFILMAIYNVLVFCLVENFNKNFWAGYAFIMVAFVALLVSFLLSNASNRAHHVVGLPLNMISLYYFIIEVILGSSLMFLKIKFVAVFLPQIVLFLLFAMVYVPALARFFSLPKENEQTKENKQ